MILASYFLAEATEEFSSLEEAKCNERKLYNWGKGLMSWAARDQVNPVGITIPIPTDDPGYSL